jgi:hypothetical protein
MEDGALLTKEEPKADQGKKEGKCRMDILLIKTVENPQGTGGHKKAKTFIGCPPRNATRAHQVV